jgi:hypothetical protein
MKYVQGHEHFYECARTRAQYAPCSCDVLRLQKKTLAQAQVPVEFQAILNPPVSEESLDIPPGFVEAVQAMPEVDASAFDAEAPGEEPEVGF